MYKTLNSKLVLIFIVFIIAVMAAVGIFLMNSIYEYYNTDFVGSLDDAFSSAAADRISEALLYDDYPAKIKEVLLAYSSSFGLDNHRNFYVLDSGANLLSSSDETASGVELTENLLSAMNGKTAKHQPYGTKYLDYAINFQNGDNACIIYIKDDLSEMQSLSFVLFSIIIKSLIIGLVIAVIMAFFLAKAITLPIKSITRGTKEIASGDYSRRLVSRSRDEIGALTRGFNKMAEVIENNLDAVSDEREKLNNIVNCLQAGVAAFDDKGAVIHLNPSLLKMLSLPEKSEPTFSEFTALVGLTEVTMKRLKKEKRLHIAEHTLSDIKTRELTVNIDFSVFEYENGTKTGFIAVIQDITEGALLEKSRREFIANVSHELRTPLTSIKGATETVLDDDDMPVAFRKKFLGIVINESDRMTRIVKDLLVLSRLDNRRMTWSPDTFDIGETLDRMCEALQTEAHNHSHELTYECAQPGSLPLYGDKERIEQVVANIIGNAIKYTPDGGKIQVKLIPHLQGKKTYEITVTDNGIGIPKEDIERLFERFYRVDKSRSTGAGGTGLGLSIAKEIVDAHNGTISVDSVEGAGTVVKILLPADTRIGENT